MAGQSKPKTAEEYVVKELLETKEENEHLKSRIVTLQEDLEDFNEDFLKIHDYFKVEQASTKNELKITYYKEPENKYGLSDTMAFSGGISPDKWNKEFSQLVDLFHLREEAEALAEELLKDAVTE